MYSKPRETGASETEPSLGKTSGFYKGSLCSYTSDDGGKSSICLEEDLKYFLVANPLENKRAVEFFNFSQDSYDVSCMLTVDHEIYCGSERMKKVDLSAIADPSSIHGLEIGNSTKCLLDGDGKGYCWGDNPYGQLGIGGDTTTRMAPVMVNMSGVLSGKKLVQISPGNAHTCALDEDGKVYCWGMGNAGRLGNGSTAYHNVPVAVTTSGVLSGKIITKISTSATHACGIDATGSAFCWGYGNSGQLGHGLNTDGLSPVAVTKTGVLNGKTLVDISSGLNFTCALDSAGSAYCWGVNDQRQLGNGLSSNSNVPVTVNSAGALSGKKLVSIQAGSRSACVVDEDGVQYCWGELFGSTPVALPMGSLFAGRKVQKAGASGTASVFGLLDDGRVAMWASSSLSSPRLAGSFAPHLMTGKKILSIATPMPGLGGSDSTCAVVADDQSVYCWGGNSSGQVGNGRVTLQPVLVPEKVQGLDGKKIVSLSKGHWYTCALDDSGTAYCWGNNNSGQLGDGTVTASATPVAVKMDGALSGKKITEIQTGYFQTCALTDTKELFCWGANYYGRLGDGTENDAYEPVAVDLTALGSQKVTQFEVRSHASCLLDDAGAIYCWGENTQGELGVQSVDSSITRPTLLKNDGSLADIQWKSLKLSLDGEGGICAIDSLDEAYCWGRNSYGVVDYANMGMGVATPTKMDFGGPVVSVYTASQFGCALLKTGEVSCWGMDFSGMLGRGSDDFSYKSPDFVNTSAYPGVKFKDLQISLFSACVIAVDDHTYCWGDSGDGVVNLTPVIQTD